MNKFPKTEHLCRKKVIESLFAGKTCSFSLFPIRVVYKEAGDLESEAQVLVSVSKRHFKRAVKRNHVKRQIREAYRLQKSPLINTLKSQNKCLAIAFIYLSNSIFDSTIIHQRVHTAIQRLNENLILSPKEWNCCHNSCWFPFSSIRDSFLPC